MNGVSVNLPARGAVSADARASERLLVSPWVAAFIRRTTFWVLLRSFDIDCQAMTSEPLPPAVSRDVPVALEQALEQSHEVRDKVEECADDLASKNEAVKQQIADGATTLPAHESLSESEEVEAKVQECADDLHQVTEILARGVEDLRSVELALASSREALTQTESSLAAAQEDERRSMLLALHDAATGLPNRNLFNDRLSHAISLAERHQWTLAVMFLDLDRFKSINDTHGHAAGDLVLKEVASRLLEHARDEDTVCRNGGDEFLYLLVNPKGAANVERIVQHVLATIAGPIGIDGVDLMITPSIGIALFPDDATTGAELVAHADAAMYRAKRQMRGYTFCGQAEATDSATAAQILSAP